jgi:DnaJ-class molecular chaperone
MCRTCSGSGRFYPIWKGKESIKTFDFPYVVRPGFDGGTTFVHRCNRCRGTGRI